MSKIPTSFLGRGSKLLGMVSKVALNEVSDRLKTWEDEKEKLKNKVQLAQDLVKTLSQLKGASMKLGQLLSLDMGDFLPPEIRKVLEELHNKSTFLPYSKIDAILRAELGEKYFDLKDISETPIAAASIGQVHKAKLNSKDIVIKVQYPGVAESIPSDLKILEMLVKQLSFLQRKSDTDVGPLLQEIKEVLLKEADYRHELLMHQKYKEKFVDKAYIVPIAYPEYSTEKVLTQEFIEGKSFTEWLETDPSDETRKEMAELLMKLYLEEIFEHGLVQTDPNPGNFLITEDNQIALLDFGATKEYDEAFVTGYRKILIASFEGDLDTIISESVKLKLIDEREEESVKRLYAEMIDFLAVPFRTDDYFDFGDITYLNRSRELSWELTKKCRYTPPPKDLLFLHRKLGGTFVFIKKMGVKIKLKDYWKIIAEKA